jgi:DNA polymerase-3 subunit beta
MEVHVDRDAFIRGLQMAHNVVEPRQTLPVLANVLLEAQGDTLRMTATDLEVSVRVTGPAKVVKPGTITISARKLMEIVKELPAAPLAIKVQENAWVALRCAGAFYGRGPTPGKFPAVGTASTGWLTLDGNIARCSHHHSRSRTTKPVCANGVLLAVRTRLQLVRRRPPGSLAVPQPPGGSAVRIVPRKAVQEVARIVGSGEEVQIAISDNQFMLRMPNVLLMARLIEGTFPNYEQVVPRAHPHRVTLSRAALTAALRRVSVLSEERTKPVRFLLTPGMLKLTANSPDYGEAEEQMEAQFAGEEIAIGFNSRYVLDTLGAQAGEQVLIELKDGLSPGVFKSFEDEGTLCVIMPMRI